MNIENCVYVLTHAKIVDLCKFSLQNGRLPTDFEIMTGCANERLDEFLQLGTIDGKAVVL